MLVGLGNPGEEYIGTRHNIGFDVLDSLAASLEIKVKKKKFGGVFGEGSFSDKKLILLKPWRFMNLSGQVVATAAGFYKLEISDLLIVTDDMALPVGAVRIRAKGSAGGHKGLVDIIEKLGTEEVNRLSVGIGSSGESFAEDYVLNRPSKAERVLLDASVERARAAVFCWLEEGIDAAMNKFNE